MKPAPFEYHAPTTVDDVIALLAEHGDEAKVLAGGQSLVPMLTLRLTRFEHIVDLDRVDDLRGVERTNGTLTVKSMTRQSDGRGAPTVGDVPLLAEAIPLIGHFQIRNRGTWVDRSPTPTPPPSCPAVALALDAELEIAGPAGPRRPGRRVLRRHLDHDDRRRRGPRAVHFPVWAGESGFVVEEIARRSGDFALAGVVCGVEVDDAGAVQRSAISFLGMAPTPVRAAPPRPRSTGRRRTPRPHRDRAALGGRHRTTATTSTRRPSTASTSARIVRARPRAERWEASGRG